MALPRSHTIPPSPFRLDTVVWELTRRCPFSCSYCGSRAGRAMPGEMGVEEQLEVADQLVELPVRRVVLLGGEVFLKPGWERVARRLMDGGRDLSIITNGWLVTPGLTDHLVEVGVPYVAVSIDGTQEVHDRNRLQGSFGRALEAVALLHRRGLQTAVITTVNHQSAPTLRELHAHVRASGADAWQIQACSPIGNGAFVRELVPTPEDLRSVVALAAELQSDELPIFVADNIGYFTPEEERIRGRVGRHFGGCSAGLSTAGIDSEGNVRGCESLYDSRFVEGSLRNESLWDIWHDRTRFAYNRSFSLDQLRGRCRDCAMRGRCGGGCRSTNWAMGGDTNATANCLFEASACRTQGSLQVL